MRRCSILATVAFLCLGLCAAARADTLTETLGPRGVALGEALRAASFGSAATVLNPAGLMLNRAYVLEGAYAFHSEDDSNMAQVSVCDSTPTRVGACVFYDWQTGGPLGGGSGERTLHVAGLTLATLFSDRMTLGVTGRYLDYTETGAAATPVNGSRDKAFQLDVGGVARMGDRLNIGVAGYNLIGGDQQDFPIGVGAGIAAFLIPQVLTLGLDGRWELVNKTGRYSFGAEYLISNGETGYPLRAGFVYDDLDGSMFLSGGAGYVTPKISIDGAIRRQVAEGEELALTIGLRFFLRN